MDCDDYAAQIKPGWATFSLRFNLAMETVSQ